jgi:hypothetical protein
MAVRIDRSKYITSPNGSGRQLMSLGRVLRKRTPQQPSADVAAAAADVDIELSKSQQVMIDRIRNHGPAVAMLDREDDGYADVLLRVCRTRVEDWQVFARPTARRMIAAKPEPDPNDAEKLAKVELAAKVYGLMFANGFDATRAPYAEQGEYMLMLERIIEEEQLEQPLIELVGQPFYTELRATTALYTAMVERRQSGDPNSGARLQDRRVALQQAIQNYLIALLAMIRDDDPDKVREIQRALGPVDAYRASFARRSATRSSAEADAEDALADGVDPSTVEELAAEQQQLDAELGLGSEAGGDSSDAALEL